jgi:hypothetical protein
VLLLVPSPPLPLPLPLVAPVLLVAPPLPVASPLALLVLLLPPALVAPVELCPQPDTESVRAVAIHAAVAALFRVFIMSILGSPERARSARRSGSRAVARGRSHAGLQDSIQQTRSARCITSR